jgi:hypothetical protein
MRKSMITICLAVFCLSAVFSSGCAAPGEKKGAHQVIGEGVANSGLIVYDVGAMFVNTVWGVGTVGYGFEDGHTLLPLYQPEKGTFEAQRF